MKHKRVSKNEIHEVEILDLSYEAYGVAKIDGFTVFIESVLPGEVVKVRIERVEKRFAFGKVLEVLKASNDRVDLIDPLGTRIGTMPLQHMAYEAQLQFKRKLVIDCFSKVMQIDQDIVLFTLGMDHPWHYRNKAQIPVREIQGHLETGFFKRNSHDLVPIENYHIQEPEIDEAILSIRNILRDLNIRAYDETNHEGCIRHIIVRRGHITKEMMVILVTNGKTLPYREALVQRILEDCPNVVSIVQNINDQKTNVIMGNTSNLLFGEDKYYDKLLDKTFAISSHSFFQVNSKQTEVLYAKALEFANISHDDIVIDAYCGIGTITLCASDLAHTVYGVEVVEDAITMAKYNASLNAITNTVFEAGKAEVVMQKWVKQGIKPDVIIVDPPRKGLAESFIDASIAMKPKRLIYVSCNPVTLAKDVKKYTEQGYELISVQPVDMFPHTTHVECITLLSLKK